MTIRNWNTTVTLLRLLTALEDEVKQREFM